MMFQKHIQCSIQGGGAKGLAYVGAYKALLKQKHTCPLTNKKLNRIPIKSMIGASVGSLLALTISTGIPEY